MVAVLFVCLGNICRSPAAEAVLKKLIEDEELPDMIIASCGIGDWHIGQLPDKRMREAGSERGLTLASRAQQFQKEYLDSFDYILAADHEVLNDLYRMAATPEHKSKIHLMMNFSESYEIEEIPDPYYGSRTDFELVLDMLEDACRGLIRNIKK